MSAVECLRQFVSQRLTAAAEEIFGVFEKTVIEYEEEIDRQRKLLDILCKPDLKLHRIELQQQHVCQEEEVLADQQLCIEERNWSSLDQEDPDPSQIKEEQQELFISQEGEQPALKQETDTLLLTPTDEESDHSEDQTVSFSIKRHHNNTSHRINVNNPELSEFKHKTHRGKKSLRCDVCGKYFQYNYILQQHMRTHTGEKPYLCKTCGRRFGRLSSLTIHTRMHTGEKPYICKTCRKCFRTSSHLKSHMRTAHTGEKPYLCNTCGKRFNQKSTLTVHTRMHTGERPYSCKTCRKCFRTSSHLKGHMRTHTGDKPYICNICGKQFCDSSTMMKHCKNHLRK
ncbi:zinc finger protein ZFP2-like [Centropristis striata]|uniref:zinc finger protein ZFP2-like n=1 Tax=Centropristis striata TaxID=184440 RepID=UPI0027DF5632|nr:zinc finger protein ZFP2-like [Centropristis striata]